MHQIFPVPPIIQWASRTFCENIQQAMKAGEADGTTVNHRLSNLLTELSHILLLTDLVRCFCKENSHPP